MQLCIEQLLYIIILEVLFVLAIFCPANIYRPSLGKVQLGRPNPKPIQPFNFYLGRKRKKPFYSELYALQWIEDKFSIIIYFKKVYQKTC